MLSLCASELLKPAIIVFLGLSIHARTEFTTTVLKRDGQQQ